MERQTVSRVVSVAILMAASTAWAYESWQANGVYGSPDEPIDGCEVLVPKDAAAVSVLKAYVKPGEKLVFVGTSDPSGTTPHNKPFPFAADAVVTVGVGQVEFQCPVTLAGDITFAGPGDNARSHSGRYLYASAEKAETLFTDMTLADFEPRTTLFDDTRVLAYGPGKAHAVKRGKDSSGNDTLVFQLQEFDGTYTKAVEVTLVQSGADVKGYVSGGWYACGKVLGLDFRTLPGTTAYSIRTPDITSSGTYGIGTDNFTLTRNGNTAAVFTRAVTGPGAIRVGGGAYVLADGAGALTPRKVSGSVSTATFTNAIDVAAGGTFAVRNHDLTLSGAITGLGTVRCDVRRQNDFRYAGQAGWNFNLHELAAPGRKFADLTNATCTLRYRYKDDPDEFVASGPNVGLTTMRSTKIETYDYYESDTKHYDVKFIQFQKKIGQTLVGFLVLASDYEEGLHVYDCRWGYRTGDEYQEGVYYFDYNENRKNNDPATGLSNGFSLSPAGAHNVQDFVLQFKDPATTFARTVSLTGNSWTGADGSAGRLVVAGDADDTVTVKATAGKAAPQWGDVLILSNATFSAGATMQNPQIYTFAGGHLKTANNGALSSSSCVINILGGDYEVTAAQELPRNLYLTDGARVYGTGTLILGQYNNTYFTFASGEGAVATIENTIEFRSRDNNVSCTQDIGAFPGACLKLAGRIRGDTTGTRQNYSVFTDKGKTGTLMITSRDNPFEKPFTLNGGALMLAANGALTNDVVLAKDAVLASAAGVTNALGTVTLTDSAAFSFETDSVLTLAGLELPADTSKTLEMTGPKLQEPVFLRVLESVDATRIRYNGRRVRQDPLGWIRTHFGVILYLK